MCQSPKLLLPWGGFGTPSNECFLRPTRVATPNGTSIAAVGLSPTTVEANRHIDHAKSATIGRIYASRNTSQRSVYVFIFIHHKRQNAMQLNKSNATNENSSATGSLIL